MGISKKELMENYYMEELRAIMQEWNEMHNPSRDKTEAVAAGAFLGDGGERL